MTLSRRSFIAGLAGLLSLLLWPWKRKPCLPEDIWETPSKAFYSMGRRQGKSGLMFSKMLEAHEKLKNAQPKTHWVTIPERNVELWEKHFPGEMI